MPAIANASETAGAVGTGDLLMVVLQAVTLVGIVAVGFFLALSQHERQQRRDDRQTERRRHLQLLNALNEKHNLMTTAVAETRREMAVLREHMTTLQKESRIIVQAVSQLTNAISDRGYAANASPANGEPARRAAPDRLPSPARPAPPSGHTPLDREILSEYRLVMDDEERVDGFLERYRALRAELSGRGELEVMDSPTADLWLLPIGENGRALLLPSRRMLTRNFPTLAANQGEGVQRKLGTLFDIVFTDVEKPVVVAAALVTLLDGQPVRLVRTGTLRFPRQ
ncbi:hypothetical protein [Azospirillum brasilense]|uniref:hypothetical protein n=1 Tax=Azospirillum brasilense TaxID=192 RepID=UPI0011C3A4C7|nr:hypothetical protein [Azospirillum brasilense]NUB27006.1 hypothetical protein [Azospirillum brasilense]NUB34788.1 hypothetical protein [Azospirillum brasilense]